MQNKANTLGWLAIFLNAGAQLLLAPIVKSNLGASGLGVWHLIFQTFVYLQLIDFGWSNGIVREIASVRDDRAGQLPQNLLKTTQRLLSATGVAFAIAGVGAAFLVPQFIDIPSAFKQDFTIAVLIFSVWGVARYHYALPLIALRGQNRLVAYNGLEILQGAGRPVLGALMVLSNLGIVGLAAGYAMAEAACRWIAVRLSRIDFTGGHFDRATFYRTLKFGGATGTISLSTLISFYSSSFIVGWKLGVTQVAVYQCTIAFPLLLMRLSIVPFTNRLPFLIASLHRNRDRSQMTATIHLHLLVLIISAGLLTGIVLANELFVTLWVGADLFAGLDFTLVFCLFVFISIARHAGFMVLQAEGRLKFLTLIHLLEVPLVLLLSIMLIDSMGLTGVAVALVVAALPSTIFSQFVFLRVKKLL